jgi:diadenylate cyclase
LEELIRRFSQLTQSSITGLVQIVDILLVAYLIDRILRLVRGTRAWRILGGIVIFAVALLLSDFLQLHTLHWILDKATILAPVALVILLLPELRQTLEGFAKLGLWPERLTGRQKLAQEATLEAITSAVQEMSTTKVGCIIVIEKSSVLDDIAATGVLLNTKVSDAALKSIFYYGNPLHDGAALIRGDQIVAAACRLPLSENLRLDPKIHMRHRAGIGISENADCLVILVSEERGTISVAKEGELFPISEIADLSKFLYNELNNPEYSERPNLLKKRIRLKKEKPVV